jgi:hypothetical protein
MSKLDYVYQIFVDIFATLIISIVIATVIHIHVMESSQMCRILYNWVVTFLITSFLIFLVVKTRPKGDRGN